MSCRFERFIGLIFFIAMACVLACHGAEARGRTSLEPAYVVTISETSPALAPFQHVRFCLQYPDDCKANDVNGNRVDLDERMMNLLKKVNHRVNVAIHAVSKSYGANLSDSWVISPETGDCNDYAVTKRHELLALGLPASVLRLSVVRTPWGEGHLVLTVATTKGDFVLDNLTENIRPWRNTGYQWIKIQSAANPRFWNEVGSLVINASLLRPAPVSEIDIPEQSLPAQTNSSAPPPDNSKGQFETVVTVVGKGMESLVSCAGLLAEVPLVL